MRLRGERALVAGQRLTGPDGAGVRPLHAALGLELTLSRRFAARCGICTPLGAVVGGERRGWRGIPLAARSPAGLFASLLVGGVPGTRLGRARIQRREERRMNEHDDRRDEPSGGTEPLEQRLLTAVGRVSGATTIAGALAAAASPEAAVGPAVSADGYTTVPLLESMFAGGYGMGLGGGNAPRDAGAGDGSSMGGGGGGGGGGAGRSRVVAVLVVGPNGVELRPVVDVTKLGLAGIAAAIGLAGIFRRWLR